MNPPSNNEGLMNMYISWYLKQRNLLWMSVRVTVTYLVYYETLLQNETNIIAKCDSYFITKCDKSLLQNASGFLLQNASVLLQIVTVITKCDTYYKMLWYKRQ